jgi:hypothetical protein
MLLSQMNRYLVAKIKGSRRGVFPGAVCFWFFAGLGGIGGDSGRGMGCVGGVKGK